MKRLAAIVKFSDDAIISRDLQGVVTTWNPGAERMYGFTMAEMIGKDTLGLAVPGRETEVEEPFEKACQGETTHQLETQRRAKNGKLLDISLTVSPLTAPRLMPRRPRCSCAGGRSSSAQR